MISSSIVSFVLYLSLLLCPADADRIVVLESSGTRSFTRGETAGVFIGENQTRVAIVGDSLKSEWKGETTSTPFADGARVRDHDWVGTPTLQLDNKISLEKTGYGHVVRATRDGGSVQTFVVIYPRPLPADAPAIEVNVIGMVQAPGRYALRQDACLAEAIAAASGINRLGSRNRISVTKIKTDGTKHSFAYDFTKLLSQGETGPKLETGDVIFVPEVCTF